MTHDQNTMTDSRPCVINVEGNSGQVNIDFSQNYHSYYDPTTNGSKLNTDWNIIVRTFFGVAGLLLQLLQMLWGF